MRCNGGTLCRIKGKSNSGKKMILSKGNTSVTERYSVKERLCSEYTLQVKVRGNTQNGKIINN